MTLVLLPITRVDPQPLEIRMAPRPMLDIMTRMLFPIHHISINGSRITAVRRSRLHPHVGLRGCLIVMGTETGAGGRQK